MDRALEIFLTLGDRGQHVISERKISGQKTNDPSTVA